MPETIRCFYSCKACGITRQNVDVPERDPETHDVVRWLQEIAVFAFYVDHSMRSPVCRPKEFSEVGIPVEAGTEHVGTKTRS